MKKKFLLFSTLILIAITALNINLSSKRDNIFTMTLKSLESQAYDLPEASITCSQSSSGPCWIWSPATKEQPGKCIITGKQEDTCIKPL